MKLSFFLFFLLITSVGFAQSSHDSTRIDTAGLYKSPIQVTFYTLLPGSNTSNKSLRIVFKNTSNKTATTIRFHWIGQTASGEYRSPGEGDITDKFKPGKSGLITLNLPTRDIDRVIIAYPYKAKFEDGSLWEPSGAIE